MRSKVLPTTKRKFLIPLLVVGLILVSIPVIYSGSIVLGANLTLAQLRFDRMAASQNNVRVLVAAKPASTATEDEIRIVFNTNHTLTTTATGITTTTAGVTSETLTGSTTCTAMPGMIGSAASSTSGTVDFVISDIATSTTYCFYITAGVGNGSVTGTNFESRVETLVSNAVTDSTRVATSIISSDQVTVTAVVPPRFSFTISATTDNFQTDLTNTRTTSTAGITVTVSTNAENGWVAWLKSTSGALGSASTGTTIPTTGTPGAAAGTITVGSSAYVLHVLKGTNNPLIDGGYDGSGGVNAGGGLSSTALQRIAYSTTVANGDTITLYGRAGVSVTQAAAADYTDVWTVVGAGQF